MTYEYDVALSFAGEDRLLAEALAERLKSNGVRVFYDKFEAHNLWGKDLFEYLHTIYANESKYCVIFVSKSYISKAWPKHERRSAQERALIEPKEYILPILVDDSHLPGLPDTVAHIRLVDYSIDQIAGLIMVKLGLTPEEVEITHATKPETKQLTLPTPKHNPEVNSRLKYHEELSNRLLPLKGVKGYFALHSLTPDLIMVDDQRFKDTFLNLSRIYSESLTYGLLPEVHPDGYTRRYEVTNSKTGGKVTTAATTCYYQSHIITEGYLDTLLENDRGLNPMWLIYKIQRHLQLTREVLDGFVKNVILIVKLENITNVGWEIYHGHKVAEMKPYVGYHKDIITEISLADIPGRDHWNTLMPQVEEIMRRLARIFGMDSLPQAYWNTERQILYPLGMPGR